MRNHLSDEELVLLYYGEARHRAAAAEHLAACQTCRAACRELESFLGQVEAPMPERDQDYGRQVWARLRPRLEDARRSPWRWPRWAWAGAVAALVVAAFVAGRFWPHPRPPEPLSPQVRERILLVTLRDHFERSEMVLIEVLHAGNGGADLSGEQDRVQDLLASNRLYRQAAAQAGRTGMAAVLDELERVLMEIAHGPARLSPAELDEMQRRIEAEGLLFRVRIIGRGIPQAGRIPKDSS